MMSNNNQAGRAERPATTNNNMDNEFYRISKILADRLNNKLMLAQSINAMAQCHETHHTRLCEFCSDRHTCGKFATYNQLTHTRTMLHSEIEMWLEHNFTRIMLATGAKAHEITPYLEANTKMQLEHNGYVSDTWAAFCKAIDYKI